MSTKIIMSTNSAKEEEPCTTKIVTSFLGLRPLEPIKASAFWDAINFKTDTSFLNPGHVDISSLHGNFEINFGEVSREYDPAAKGGTVPGFNPIFDFLSTDENFDPLDGIQTTSMAMVVDGAVEPPQFAGKL